MLFGWDVSFHSMSFNFVCNLTVVKNMKNAYICIMFSYTDNKFNRFLTGGDTDFIQSSDIENEIEKSPRADKNM